MVLWVVLWLCIMCSFGLGVGNVVIVLGMVLLFMMCFIVFLQVLVNMCCCCVLFLVVVQVCRFRFDCISMVNLLCVWLGCIWLLIFVSDGMFRYMVWNCLGFGGYCSVLCRQLFILLVICCGVMLISIWNYNLLVVVRLFVLFIGVELFLCIYFLGNMLVICFYIVYSMFIVCWLGLVVDGFEFDVDDIVVCFVKVVNFCVLFELLLLFCDLIGRIWLMVCIGVFGGIGDCGYCVCCMVVVGGFDCLREWVCDWW